jgi:hypothetical protein
MSKRSRHWRYSHPEIERGLGAETSRGFGLQRLMLGMIAAQQPRAAGAHGHAAGDGVGRGAP